MGGGSREREIHGSSNPPPESLAGDRAVTSTAMHAPQLIHAGTGLPFSDKGRKTAGLLQLLLCPLGAGRFYLGYPKVAVLQILVTWCTCGAGALWPIVDGVRMLEGRIPDANGHPLRED